MLATVAAALFVLPVLPPADVGWTYQLNSVSGETIGWRQLVRTVRRAWI